MSIYKASSTARLRDDDYQRIAAAIRWIDTHASEQPSSADIAAAAGLSEAHFSRLFRRWAGIAPGRYLKHRTLLAARAALDRGATVLDAALDSGLSGPGRLHDLFVSIDALSPGEYKQGGAGLLLRFGEAKTPFGPVFLLRSARGIVELGFCGARSANAMLDDAAMRWHAAEFMPDETAQATVDQAFFGDQTGLVLNPVGTNFQLKVWQALLTIPPGAAFSYADVATLLGKPSASRAVGNAVGANPIAFLIPCHRVLRANGGLGGYRWGPERKSIMHAWEHCQALATTN
ncbi:MAG: bifunctional helix-turn-helix domain-containing protein/methylated-DNA--[protein]-cysteine S-methyltransferase [Pseudomonadota bacterium]